MTKDRKDDFLLKLLSVFVFIGFLGAVKPVLFNEGSAMAKYLAKQKQLELVHEKEVELYMESALFGDGHVSLDSSMENISENKRNESASIIFKYDTLIAAFLLIASLTLLWPKMSFNLPLYHLLIPIFLWLFCQSIATSLNGGKKFSDFAVLAHATRWGLPLVLWFGLFLRRRGKDFSDNKASIITLVLCSALTFVVHGWEAYSLNPSFQDLLYNFGSLLGWEMSVSVNTAILKTVGCMDIFLAVSLLFIRSPKLLLWMAFWGIITLLSRPLTIGFGAWPECAIRMANFALPLCLFLIYRDGTKKAVIDEPEMNNKKLETLYE
jgi:hypothetical protein